MGWIPGGAKEHGEHEPRNGLTMCKNHHDGFDRYYFFMRYFPELRKFVFINYGGEPEYEAYHYKAIALNIDDRHAPFPALFIIHEMRVRGFRPFQPLDPPVPDEIQWQDWLPRTGAINDSGTFNRASPPQATSSTLQHQSQAHLTMTGIGTTSSGHGTRTLALNSNVIADILAATRASPSWKACVMEGTSWDGTAEDNIQKYMSTVGVENES
jgi:hypothetical protein